MMNHRQLCIHQGKKKENFYFLFFIFVKESTFLEEKRKLGELKVSGRRGAFFFFSPVLVFVIIIRHESSSFWFLNSI